MSSLLRSGEAQSLRVRTLPASLEQDEAIATPPPIDVERLALEEEIAVLHRAVEQRDEEIRRLHARVQDARIDGEASGREAGLRAADDHRVEALELLAAGIDRALAEQSRQSVEMEALAVQIARAGLEKMVGAAGPHGELIASIVRDQALKLAQEGWVKLEVSSKDFDQADIARLPSAAGRPDLVVEASAALPSGACRIRLRLGALEVGLDEQWPRLRAFLEQMGEVRS
ncbi:MAG TPA: hypothetical protein VIO94_13505 [Phenylobacterium sp.]